MTMTSSNSFNDIHFDDMLIDDSHAFSVVITDINGEEYSVDIDAADSQYDLHEDDDAQENWVMYQVDKYCAANNINASSYINHGFYG